MRSRVRRGVSLPGALLTLALLTLVVVGLLNVFDRSTRMVRYEGQTLDLGASIRAAAHALGRDVRAAGAGIPSWMGLVARSNNSSPDASFQTAAGRVPVRAGTDQLEVRGVLSTPVFRLDAAPLSASGETVLRIPASRPTPSWVRNASPEAFGFGVLEQGGWGTVVARAAAPVAGASSPAGAPPDARSFFAVGDDEGHVAIARIRAANVEGAGTSRTLALSVTFDDPDARALSPGGAAALGRLEEASTGGILDDLTYFVARGEPGGPPDYFAGIDPESLAFPHPYLAVARYAGAGRYEVLRVADDIEDFQVAYLISAGTAGRWVGGAASASPPPPLVDPVGRPLTRLVRIGLVEKSPFRDLRVDLTAGEAAGSRQDGFRLLDAPAPTGSRLGPGPVGWSPSPAQRASFERRAQLLSYVPRNLAGGGR